AAGKEAREIGRIFEPQIVRDLADRPARIEQLPLRLEHHPCMYQVDRWLARRFEACAAQLRFGHAQRTRIVRNGNIAAERSFDGRSVAGRERAMTAQWWIAR